MNDLADCRVPDQPLDRPEADRAPAFARFRLTPRWVGRSVGGCPTSRGPPSLIPELAKREWNSRINAAGGQKKA
jgi:hypothetical protein